MTPLDPSFIGLKRRAQAFVRLLRGRPPRKAPSGRVHLPGLAGPLEEGALDGVVNGVAIGWARRRDAPERPTAIDLYVDGRFVGRAQADRYRADLATAGQSGMHGFSQALPLSAMIGAELRAFAAASGLELGGSPRALAGAASVRLSPRAARRFLKLDFSTSAALTIAEQMAHYGRHFAVLTEADPAYPDGAWPISRCMGYVDARKLDGRSSIGGAASFFRLFDAAAKHFSATPYGLPIGQGLLAALTASDPTSAGGAPNRLLELIIQAAVEPGPSHPTPAEYAGIALNYLYARRLPVDLLGESLRQLLCNPAQRLLALRQLSTLQEVAGSDEALTAAADALGLSAALQGDAPAQIEPGPPRTGVRIISADYGDTGLGANVGRTLEAMQRLHLEHEHSSVRMEALSADLLAPGRLFDTVLIHAQPPDAVEIILRLPPSQAAQRLIGFYMWETETAPQVFDLGLRLVDEVWTGSRFSADAFASRGASSNVHVVGHAVVTRPYSIAHSAFDARTFAGAAASSFLVYTHFDAASWVTRKNPMAAARAFRRAFPRGDEPCRLLIKTRGAGPDKTEAVRAAWDDLHEQVLADPRIRLVDCDLDQSAASALMRAADCYISLHRAEGFGSAPVEALLAGVP